MVFPQRAGVPGEVSPSTHPPQAPRLGYSRPLSSAKLICLFPFRSLPFPLPPSLPSLPPAAPAPHLSRRFGTKCAGCAQGISPSDLVRKARSKVFHLNCFTCMVCNKQLSTGEELYVIDENKFVCKDDYLSSASLKEGSLNSGKRPGRRSRRPPPPPLGMPSPPCHWGRGRKRPWSAGEAPDRVKGK